MPTFQELLDLAGTDDFTPDNDYFTSLGSAHSGELEALTSAQEKILALEAAVSELKSKNYDLLIQLPKSVDDTEDEPDDDEDTDPDIEDLFE